MCSQHPQSVSLFTNRSAAFVAFALMAIIMNGMVASNVAVAQDFEVVESTFTIFPDAGQPEVEVTPATRVLLGHQKRDPLDSLFNPSVLKDLEIIGEQKEKIIAIGRDFGAKFQNLMKAALEARGDQETIKNISQTYSKLQDERSKALENVLLPHQLERVKQVSQQIRMRARGAIGAFQSGELAEELEMTAEQKKQISEIQQQLSQKLAKETARLKAEAKRKVMSVLSMQQKTKLKKLVGEEFRETQQDWQELQPPKPPTEDKK